MDYSCHNIFLQNSMHSLKGQSRKKSMWVSNVHFSRRQQSYHLFGCDTYANRAFTAQSWDYLVYLRNLAVHKDHILHHRMTSQSALLSWHHQLTVGNVCKSLANHSNTSSMPWQQADGAIEYKKKPWCCHDIRQPYYTGSSKRSGSAAARAISGNKLAN